MTALIIAALLALLWAGIWLFQSLAGIKRNTEEAA